MRFKKHGRVDLMKFLNSIFLYFLNLRLNGDITSGTSVIGKFMMNIIEKRDITITDINRPLPALISSWIDIVC